LQITKALVRWGRQFITVRVRHQTKLKRQERRCWAMQRRNVLAYGETKRVRLSNDRDEEREQPEPKENNLSRKTERVSKSPSQPYLTLQWKIQRVRLRGRPRQTRHPILTSRAESSASFGARSIPPVRRSGVPVAHVNWAHGSPSQRIASSVNLNLLCSLNFQVLPGVAKDLRKLMRACKIRPQM